ncbi:hypothetical protein LINPERPRIM_LOCUS14613 [Linum perenne]
MQDEAISNPRCPKISFSPEEIRSFYKPWSKALVVKVLERSFAFPVIKRRLESLWARSGQIQVSDMSNAFFLVRFSEADDYQRAAFGGPWKIFDYYITVARWSPEFNEDAPIQKILTWVRLPKLPIHYFNPVAVERIGNHIGRTIRLDLATAEGARARYARVCVEIDLTKPLLGKYMVDDRTLYIEYESLDNICFSCGLYGHKDGECPLKASSTMVPPSTSVPVVPEPKVDEGDSGSWMTVTRRNRKGGNKTAAIPTPTKASGSRFSILTCEKQSVALLGKMAAADLPVQVESPAPSEFAEHADQLGKVLQLAMGPEQAMETYHIKNASEPSGALKDISNTQTSLSTTLGPISDSALISIPIAYGNAAFTSDRGIPKTKPKGKQKENRTVTQVKNVKHDNQRKFATKKASVIIEESTKKNAGVVTSGKVSVSEGRPPDSCI